MRGMIHIAAVDITPAVACPTCGQPPVVRQQRRFTRDEGLARAREWRRVNGPIFDALYPGER